MGAVVTYDLAVNGTPRGHNGKGVKAIFHSAFVVAVLIYCRENKLPHPGFVILESPLVTYRKPILYKRYGELDADEAVVAQTGLKHFKFYEHLASLSDLGQFFVVENNDPPVYRHERQGQNQTFLEKMAQADKDFFRHSNDTDPSSSPQRRLPEDYEKSLI